MIKNFAVVDDPQVSRLVAHRLLAGRQIDNAEAAVAERGPAIEIAAGFIRAAMLDHAGHQIDWRLLGCRRSRNEARDSTHRSYPTMLFLARSARRCAGRKRPRCFALLFDAVAHVVTCGLKHRCAYRTPWHNRTEWRGSTSSTLTRVAAIERRQLPYDK